MMTSTIELIKQLREQTGAGVLDCRLALEQANVCIRPFQGTSHAVDVEGRRPATASTRRPAAPLSQKYQ